MTKKETRQGWWLIDRVYGWRDVPGRPKSARFLGKMAMQFGKRVSRASFYACETRTRGEHCGYTMSLGVQAETHARVAGCLRGNRLDSTRLAASSIGEVVATQPRLRREVNTSRHPTFTSVASRSVVTRLPLVAIAATNRWRTSPSWPSKSFPRFTIEAYSPPLEIRSAEVANVGSVSSCRAKFEN